MSRSLPDYATRFAGVFDPLRSSGISSYRLKWAIVWAKVLARTENTPPPDQDATVRRRERHPRDGASVCSCAGGCASPPDQAKCARSLIADRHTSPTTKTPTCPIRGLGTTPHRPRTRFFPRPTSGHPIRVRSRFDRQLSAEEVMLLRSRLLPVALRGRITLTGAKSGA